MSGEQEASRGTTEEAEWPRQGMGNDQGHWGAATHWLRMGGQAPARPSVCVHMHTHAHSFAHSCSHPLTYTHFQFTYIMLTVACSYSHTHTSCTLHARSHTVLHTHARTLTSISSLTERTVFCLPLKKSLVKRRKESKRMSAEPRGRIPT